MRITQSSSVGLIATHSALTTGVHGVTGTLVGTTDTQTLTNKILSTTSITVINASTGSDPTLTSNSTGQILRITGHIETDQRIHWFDGSGFTGQFVHANSVGRAYTFPDVSGNVLVDTDTGKSLSLAQLTIENAGAGSDPVLVSSYADQILQLTGSILCTDHGYFEDNIEFKAGTGYYGKFDHSITAARTWTFPDVAGTVCMWDADNSAVTRYWSMGGRGMLLFQKDDGTFPFVFDVSNSWAESPLQAISYKQIHLPHGATVTALRVTSQETSSGTVNVYLRQITQADGTDSEMATVEGTSTLEEVSDTSIDPNVIDNNTYTYYLKFTHGGADDEIRVTGIQIDYTVVRPQP